MIEQLGQFWRSQTLRLTAIYLAIIMLMSVVFSTALYTVSANHLNRQVPGAIIQDDNGRFNSPPRIIRYLEQLTEDSKRDLMAQFVLLNIVVFLFGGALSFILARWTLEPIERNVAMQTRFVSDASHELRTPLTAIQTTNEVALRRQKLTVKDARAIIESNLDDVHRLQRMTSLLLELAADDRKLMVAREGIHDIVSLSLTSVAVRAIEQGITIHDTTTNDFVLVDIDSAAQALTILLDNAIKYSSKNDTVTLSTTSTRRNHVAIHVSDNGPGIARTDQKKIFDRFYRTDEARTKTGKTNGYGLGLEIAQKIALAHNGSIELKSVVGKGSTFSLVLPKAKLKKFSK